MRVPDEAWATARLKPIDAFRVLAFNHPVNAYLQSFKEGSEDHPEVRRKQTWVAVYRKNYEVWRLDLGRPGVPTPTPTGNFCQPDGLPVTRPLGRRAASACCSKA